MNNISICARRQFLKLHYEIILFLIIILLSLSQFLICCLSQFVFSDRRIEFRQSAHRFQGLAGNFAVGSTSAAGPSNVNNSCGSIVARSFATSARSHNENHRHGSSSLNAAHLAHPNNISK